MPQAVRNGGEESGLTLAVDHSYRITSQRHESEPVAGHQSLAKLKSNHPRNSPRRSGWGVCRELKEKERLDQSALRIVRKVINKP